MCVQAPAAGTSTAAASSSQPVAGSEGDDWAAFMDAATATGPAHSASQPAAAAEDHWDAFQVRALYLHSHGPTHTGALPMAQPRRMRLVASLSHAHQGCSASSRGLVLADISAVAFSGHADDHSNAILGCRAAQQLQGLQGRQVIPSLWASAHQPRRVLHRSRHSRPQQIPLQPPQAAALHQRARQQRGCMPLRPRRPRNLRLIS